MKGLTEWADVWTDDKINWTYTESYHAGTFDGETIALAAGPLFYGIGRSLCWDEEE